MKPWPRLPPRGARTCWRRARRLWSWVGGPRVIQNSHASGSGEMGLLRGLLAPEVAVVFCAETSCLWDLLDASPHSGAAVAHVNAEVLQAMSVESMMFQTGGHHQPSQSLRAGRPSWAPWILEKVSVDTHRVGTCRRRFHPTGRGTRFGKVLFEFYCFL